MIDIHEADYYQRRAARERDLASRAANEKVAKLHSQLADHYVELLETQPRPKLTLAYSGRR